jgi:hypothetical protein
MTPAPLLIGFLLFQRQFVQSFMRAQIRRRRHLAVVIPSPSERCLKAMNVRTILHPPRVAKLGIFMLCSCCSLLAFKIWAPHPALDSGNEFV